MILDDDSLVWLLRWYLPMMFICIFYCLFSILRYFCFGISSLESIQIQFHPTLHPRGAVTKSGAQSLVSTQDAAAKTARHTQLVSSLTKWEAVRPDGTSTSNSLGFEESARLGGSMSQPGILRIGVRVPGQGLEAYSSYLIPVASGSCTHWMFTSLWHFHMGYMHI